MQGAHWATVWTHKVFFFWWVGGWRAAIKANNLLCYYGCRCLMWLALYRSTHAAAQWTFSVLNVPKKKWMFIHGVFSGQDTRTHNFKTKDIKKCSISATDTDVFPFFYSRPLFFFHFSTPGLNTHTHTHIQRTNRGPTYTQLSRPRTLKHEGRNKDKTHP